MAGMKKDHTYFYVYNTIHDFKLSRKRELMDIMRGKYKLYRCANCGIQGRRYGQDRFITIRKQYSQQKLSKCNMEEVKVKRPGIFVRIIENIFGYRKEEGTRRTNNTKNVEHLKVGTVHKVLDKKGNDHKGVWVQGVDANPVKLANFEIEIAAKSKRTKKSSKRTKHVKTSKRTKF